MSANKWKIEKVRLEDAKILEENPRVISDRAMKGLRESLERFGYVEPIVWNKTTGHIVGGHQRYKVLVEMGVREAAMVVVEMTPEDELAANLTLNNPAIEGKWDEPISSLLAHIEDSDKDLFNSLNMDKLRDSVEVSRIEPDAPPEGDMPPDGSDKPAWDTKCPCCGHEFKIEAADVAVEESV